MQREKIPQRVALQLPKVQGTTSLLRLCQLPGLGKAKGESRKAKALEPNKRPAPDPASERKVRRRVSFDDTSVGSGPEGASACLEPSAVDVRILLPSLKSVPAGPSSMWTPDSSAGKQPKILNCILNLDI